MGEYLFCVAGLERRFPDFAEGMRWVMADFPGSIAIVYFPDGERKAVHAGKGTVLNGKAVSGWVSPDLEDPIL